LLFRIGIDRVTATRMLALAIYSFCSSTSTIKYSNGMRRELGQSRIFRVMELLTW
jgi:hypothetical protein